MDEKKGTKEEKGTKGNGVHVSESQLTFCWTKGWGIKGDKGGWGTEFRELAKCLWKRGRTKGEEVVEQWSEVRKV